MSWLDRVRKNEKGAPEDLTKLTEAPFVSSVSALVAPIPNLEAAPVNDPEFSEHDPSGEGAVAPINPERSARARETLVMLFHRRGLRNDDAGSVADGVLRRARDFDDRRICLECRRLSGNRCMVPDIAGAGAVVTPLLRLPQRCPGFEAAA